MIVRAHARRGVLRASTHSDATAESRCFWPKLRPDTRVCLGVPSSSSPTLLSGGRTHVMALHPCPRCQRHVHHREARCPFCDETLEAMPSDLSPLPRMSRAAMVLSTALTLCTTGCEKKQPSQPSLRSQPSQPSTEPNLNDPNAVAAVYGAPPQPETQDAGSSPPVADPSASPLSGPDASGGSNGPGRAGFAAGIRYGAPPNFDDASSFV
jgi:hypothetical protein